MSCTVADEMFYYLRRRPDAYIESRLKDTVGWSLQTFNTFDREYDYGRAGWMSERFCHCEGLLVQTYPDGSLASTWFCADALGLRQRAGRRVRHVVGL